MVLYEHAIVDGKTQICRDCETELKLNRTPSLSLANNMWIGDIPPELSCLTLPERVLIARYFPAAYIVKLYPKNQHLRLDPRSLTSGLKGNVTTYPLDAKALSGYLDGKTLPPHPRILAATIGITFVGLNNAPEQALKGLFQVSRTRVSKALAWLHENNPLYKNVTINSANLAALPEGDIPPELQQTVKISDNPDVLEQEHGGYVPDTSGIPKESGAATTG